MFISHRLAFTWKSSLRWTTLRSIHVIKTIQLLAHILPVAENTRCNSIHETYKIPEPIHFHRGGNQNFTIRFLNRSQIDRHGQSEASMRTHVTSHPCLRCRKNARGMHCIFPAFTLHQSTNAGEGIVNEMKISCISTVYMFLGATATRKGLQNLLRIHILVGWKYPYIYRRGIL